MAKTVIEGESTMYCTTEKGLDEGAASHCC